MRAERLKRVKSGCQDCRKRKVRCPEGKYLPQGGREECLMCKRGGVRCFYPQIRPGEGKLVWVPASKCQDPSIQTPSDWTTTSLDHHPIASSSRSTLDIFDIDLNSSEDFINQYLEIDSFLTNNEDEEFNLLARNDRESTIESFQSTEPALSVIEGSNQLPLWQRRAIRALLNPLKSVPKTISQPGITQMTKDQMDVFVVRTFEREGCKDIVSVGHPNRNWIHAFLLPRTEDIFNSCSEIMNKSSFNNPKLGLKQYTFHALMLLSYTCQANMQKNESVAFEATSRAAKHRSLARSIALQLRVRHPASVWQVEEYL